MKINELAVLLLLVLGAVVAPSAPVHAATAAQLDHDARVALHKLYQKSPKAREIGNQAYAALVFPKVIKGGFIFGAHGGDGVLLTTHAIGFYNTSAVSYGLQAGVQTYGYVLFFMNHRAMTYLDRSGGWEIGTGPSIVIVDTGAATGLSTTTGKKDICAFTFNQKGLMAGLGLQGTKITRYTPDK